MRRDARKLLDKLSRKDFRYREFEDAFSETELWPIFEIVLRDERVVGQDHEGLNRPRRSVVPGETADIAPTATSPTPLFERYHAQPKPEAAPDRVAVDLRDYFSRFAELD